jgi:hypothetical protein
MCWDQIRADWTDVDQAHIHPIIGWVMISPGATTQRSKSNSPKSAMRSRASLYHKLAWRIRDASQALQDLASVTLHSGPVSRDLEAVPNGNTLPPTTVTAPTSTLRMMGVITSPSISNAAVAAAAQLGPTLDRYHPRPRFAARWPDTELDG